MPAIYLIRHGQASFGQDDYDRLSSLGEEQASILGSELSKRITDFDVVAKGTMLRHQQTAELCLAKFKLAENAPIHVESAAWNEYDHQNILAQFDDRLATAAGTEAYIKAQKNPVEAFEKVFNGAIDRWITGENSTGYIESWQQFRDRLTRGLSDLIEAHSDAKHIAVFTSGGPISLLSQALLGVPEHKIMNMNWTLVNCGVTKVVASRGRQFVATLNDHSHFEGKQKNLITYK